MTEMIYYQWINATVSEDELPSGCKPVVAGICTKCERSPQLALGVKASELLRNIQEK